MIPFDRGKGPARLFMKLRVGTSRQRCLFTAWLLHCSEIGYLWACWARAEVPNINKMYQVTNASYSENTYFHSSHHLRSWSEPIPARFCANIISPVESEANLKHPQVLTIPNRTGLLASLKFWPYTGRVSSLFPQHLFARILL